MSARPIKPSRSESRRGVWRLIRLGALLAVLIALVMAIRPVRMRYLLVEGRRELERENFSGALACFEEAQQVDSAAAAPHFWMARVHRKRGDFDAVRKELDAAKRLGYHDLDRLRREWWLVLAEAGHLNQVESRLPEMLQNAEDNAEVCEAFTNGYCLHLRFGEAEALLDAWQADYPDDYRPYLRRGQIHASLEAWPQAEASLQKALKLAPNVDRIRRELAEALLHLGRLEEAGEQIAVVVRANPQDIRALATFAEILKERKQFTQAERQLRRLLDLAPDGFTARLSLAKMLLKAGIPDDAVEEAEQLAQQWPDDLETVYTHAQALRAAGRMEEAERQFDRYAELTPVLARLEKLKTEVRQNPADPQVRFELGQTLLRHVSREEGVLYLQSVLLFEPDHAEAHRALADYHARHGNAELARRHAQYTEPHPAEQSPDLRKSLSGRYP